MKSVLLVEDHALMARAVTRLLQGQESLNVVGVAVSAETVEEKLNGLDVDLVLVDVSLPLMNGIDLVARLHRDHPGLPCMMLSGHNSNQYVTRSLAAGARGYVLKDDIEGILEGVSEILAGNVYISKELRDD